MLQPLPWRKLMQATVLAIASVTAPAIAEEFSSPDILVLGDSQISFGSGPVFADFLSDLATSCDANMRQKRLLKKLGDMNVGVIGVRSTSIHSWMARKAPTTHRYVTSTKSGKLTPALTVL